MSEARLYLTLGQELKKMRKHHQVNQLALSIKLRIQRTSISNIENGKQRAPIHIYYNAFAYFDELEKLASIIRRNDL